MKRTPKRKKYTCIHEVQALVIAFAELGFRKAQCAELLHLDREQLEYWSKDEKFAFALNYAQKRLDLLLEEFLSLANDSEKKALLVDLLNLLPPSLTWAPVSMRPLRRVQEMIDRIYDTITSDFDILSAAQEAHKKWKEYPQ